MAITITAKQRDALCDLLLDRLDGIEDVRIAAQQGDFDTAQRLGREVSDDLQLVLNLGWGDDRSGGNVELRTSPEILRRALPRLEEAVRRHSAGHEPELAELREVGERNRLIEEACRHVLAELGDE